MDKELLAKAIAKAIIRRDTSLIKPSQEQLTTMLINDIPDDNVTNTVSVVSNSDTVNILIHTTKPHLVPVKAHDDDAGYDMFVDSIECDTERDRIIVHTGVYLDIPKGYHIELVPRSNLTKSEWYIPNAPGIIDTGYHGEILIVFKHRDSLNIGELVNDYDKGPSAHILLAKMKDSFPYAVGDRPAQLLLVKDQAFNFVQVDTIEALGESERGTNGYGSTGGHKSAT